MTIRLFLPCALIALAACSSPAEVAEKTGVEPTATSSASAKAVASDAKGTEVSEHTDVFHFDFALPAQAVAIPALAKALEADARKVQDEMAVEAAEMKRDSASNDYPFNPHSYGANWQLVADLPGFVSLSNDWSTYSGGAHGMYGVEGYVWDKAKGRGFASGELFMSPDYLGETMGDAVCKAVERERRERRGADYTADGGVFDDCPKLDEATVLVGSSNGKTFDRITVFFGPYVAGPYAEGAYELDFPMTAAMLEAVKPAYRPAFSAKR